MKNLTKLLFVFFVVFLLNTGPARAENVLLREEAPVTTNQGPADDDQGTQLIAPPPTDVTSIISTSSEIDELDGIPSKNPAKIPSGFGLFWHDIKDNLIVMFTFDETEKMEKRLQIAQNRTKLAQYMLENSTDPKVQKKAQQLLERTNKVIEKIQEKETFFEDKSDAKKQRIANNILRLEANQVKFMENIGDKLPPEKVQELEKKLEERRARFFEKVLNSPNVPEENRAKVGSLKTGIEERQKNKAEKKDQKN